MKYVVLEYGVGSEMSNPTGEIIDSQTELTSQAHMNGIHAVLRRYLPDSVEIVGLPIKHAEKWLQANWQDVGVMSASVGDFFNSEYLAQYKDKIYMCCSSSNEGAGTIGGLAKKPYWHAIGAVDVNMVLRDYSSWKDDYVKFVGIADETYTYNKMGTEVTEKLRGTSYSCPQHGAQVMLMMIGFYEKYGRRPRIDEVLTTLKTHVTDINTDGYDQQTGFGYYEYTGGLEMAYTDVNKDRWSHDDIMLLAELGLMTGFEDGTFRPEENLTREQMATVVSRLLKKLSV